MTTAKGDAVDIMNRIRHDPQWFFETFLNCKPWSKQIEIAEAIRDHKDVAAKSCHAVGKDWIAARIALWFLYAHYPSLVVTTAPTDRQCKEILWREIEQAWRRSRWPLGGDLLTQSIRISADQMAIGFTASATDPDKFQGFHCENILVILDEACGISPSTYVAVDACLTSANAHRLEIGNPTMALSEFARSFKAPGVHKVSISAFETPNFTAFDITEDDIIHDTWRDKVTAPLPVPELITPEFVAKMYQRWGRESPLYQSRILAKFPANSSDALITLDQVEHAQQITIPASDPKILAVDVARFGSDFTVIMSREGAVCRTRDRFSGFDTMATTGRVVQAYRAFRPEYVVVDGVGLGAGVVDRLRELKIPVREFNGGANPRDDSMYANARAEGYWRLREALEAHDIDLDPADEHLIGQLTDIKWSTDSRGRVKLESKDDIKKRLGHSPDDADALSMLYAPSVMSEPVFFDASLPSIAPSRFNAYGTDYERMVANG